MGKISRKVLFGPGCRRQLQHLFLNLLRHLVEIRCQLADLILRADTDPFRIFSSGYPSGRLADLFDRAGDHPAQRKDQGKPYAQNDQVDFLEVCRHASLGIHHRTDIRLCYQTGVALPLLHMIVHENKTFSVLTEDPERQPSLPAVTEIQNIRLHCHAGINTFLIGIIDCHRRCE